jgi:carboxymethylenebutenolidase
MPLSKPEQGVVHASSEVIQTRWIEIDCEDGDFPGYLALPPTGSGPGIVLIQEIFGVNQHIRAVAEQYALAGYVVLAPDLYWRVRPHIELGYNADTMKEGFGHAMTIGIPTQTDDLEASVSALRALPETTGKVTSIGYCMGGTLSYLLATRNVVDASVCYYGGSIHTLLDDAVKASGPILMHFAGEDDYVSAESLASVRQAFARKPLAQIHEYPGAHHGFNCWARPSHSQSTAALALGRTLEFLAAQK